MGRNIFGIDFGSVAFAIKKIASNNAIGSYFRLHERNFQHILYEDIEKLFLFSNGKIDYKYNFNKYRGDEGITEEGTEIGQKLFYPNMPQTNFVKIPGSPIFYWVSMHTIETFQGTVLNEIAKAKAGLQTGKNALFVRDWSEVDFRKTSIKSSELSDKWFPYCKGGGNNKWYGLNSFLVDWEDNGKRIHEYNNIPLNYSGAPVRAKQFYFKEGLSYSLINSTGNFCARYIKGGGIFDNGGPTFLVMI
ncbi:MULTISPECIES: hypothetical protein [unclassified Polaribacter]|uniref:hypothetical protein n=1 Tax=unclassified Polaribacter TaxID=196858 RepID=UPI0011BF3B32|nr:MULTISPECIES: hypothetical protein [unclassified Polaribacter]TXD51069.1 hypothetical protein ES043_13575 [Polaribacter sp. IC063]TXD57950.1 hypothetical protein ES044_13715 [Polaribacter sp. IC066]